MKEDILVDFTIGEILSAMTSRRTAVDSDKSLEQLSIGELFVLGYNQDELERYKRERIKKIEAELSKVKESDYDVNDYSDDESIHQLLEMYGRL